MSRMTTLFLYIVSASSDPDNITCPVPFRINGGLIFFGPCKKKLRDLLRDRFLKGSSEVILDDDVYIVGMNGGNNQRVRKIIWAGRINRLMTFEAAYNSLIDSEFEEMRSHPYSPLNVKPIYDSNGCFIGYESRSREHRDNDAWHLDVVRTVNEKQVYLEPKRLLLRESVRRSDAFKRDCCFLCDNLFFANGSGVPISDNMLDILRRAQGGRDIDKYAIFGYSANGAVDGKRGSYLTLSGGAAEDFIRQIVNNVNPMSLKGVVSINKSHCC